MVEGIPLVCVGDCVLSLSWEEGEGVLVGSVVGWLIVVIDCCGDIH